MAPATAPSPPTGLDVAVDAADVVLTWSAPDDEGSSAVTGYRVAVRNYHHYPTEEVDADVRTATFTGLPAGVYTASVVALSDDGESESAAEEVTVAPGVPTQVQAVQVGDGIVGVTWEEPGNVGGTPLAGYTVEVEGGESQDLDVDARSTTFGGLDPGDYVVTVQAFATFADGDTASSPVSVSGSPSAPANVLAQPSGGGTATVSWDESPDLGNSPLTGYSVPLDGVLAGEVGVSPRELVLDGLAPGEYLVQVTASTEYAHSGPGSSSLVMPALPGEPVGVRAEQTGPTSVPVTWDAPSAEGASPVIGYLVAASPVLLTGVLDDGLAASAPGGQRYEVSEDTFGYEFTGLLPDTPYRFTVAAITADGIGEPGSDDEQTEEWRAPSVPTDVSVRQTGARQVTFRFGAPEDPGISNLTGYVLGVSGPDSGGSQELDADVREVVHDDLAPGRYVFRILAMNEQGADGAAVDVELTVDGPTVVDDPDETPDDTPVVVETPVVTSPVVNNAPVRSTGTLPATVTYTSAGQGALARTGTEAGTVALGGALLLLMGAGALVAGRRRQGASA